MGSFGDKLKKEREQRSISLDDISLSTKIGTRLLRALEEEKFDQLPGGIFNKGFVRAYARHVGLDEEQAIADYMAALGESQTKTSAETEVAAKPVVVPERRTPPEPNPLEHQPASDIPWGLLALLLVLIALAFASWNYYHRDQRADSRNATTVPDSARAPATAPASTPTPAPGTSAPNQTFSATSPAGGPQTSSGASPTNSPAGTFIVLLKGNEESEESWVAITVDGQPAGEVTLSAPTQKEIQGTREIVIKAGNVGALDFYFNGKKLPPQGQYGVVKTLTFHADGLQPPPPKPSAPPATTH